MNPVTRHLPRIKPRSDSRFSPIHVIEAIHMLRSEHGENPEYDRALVEVAATLLGRAQWYSEEPDAVWLTLLDRHMPPVKEATAHIVATTPEEVALIEHVRGEHHDGNACALCKATTNLAVTQQRLDSITGGEVRVTEPDVEWVVTRYGGHRHAPMFLDTNSNSRNRRFTLCRGVSAWTLVSWASVPDHPTLTVEEIEALPFCPACQSMLA